MNIKDEVFIRKWHIIPEKQYAFFLGAGASASSNIPTAREMIWDFKKQLYASAKSLNLTFINQKDYDFREEIENWVRINYSDISENDYGFFFAECFPSKEDRKNYIQGKVKLAQPSIGYQILRFLIEKKSVWHYLTTNFDNLIQKVYPNTIEISEENIEKRKDKIRVNSDFPIIIKLHGDFRYDWLKNTSSETQNFCDTTNQKVTDLLKSLGLIVIGYSGRDESVMNLLENYIDSFDNPFPNGIYWCVRKNENVDERVIKLLTKVKAKDRTANIVEINSFDDLMIGVYNQAPGTDEQIEKVLQDRPKLRAFKVVEKNTDDNYIGLNFLKITKYPTNFLTFKFKNIKDWNDLETITKDKQVISSFFRDNKVIAIGDRKNIMETFKKHIADKEIFSTYTITESDLNTVNAQRGFIIGLFYKLFNWHFENILQLKKYIGKRRRFYLDKVFTKEFGRYNRSVKYYKAFSYSLEYRNKELLFIFSPYYLVSNFKDLPEDQLFIKQNFLISNIFNDVVCEDLKFWINLLKDGCKDSINIYYPSNNCVFNIYPKCCKSGEST